MKLPRPKTSTMGRPGDLSPAASLMLLHTLTLWVILRNAVVVGHGKVQHLVSRRTLATCKYDNDCMPNAYCRNQKNCHCKDNFIAYKMNHSHTECLKAASSLGDQCKVDIQCQITFSPYAECRDNECQCSLKSIFREGQCYPGAGLGEICLTSHNCRVNNSYCMSGHCFCSVDTHASSDNKNCLKNVALSEECSNDDQCITDNSRCLKVCTCKIDYVLSKNGDKCLKSADKIGDPCEQDSQCSEYLINSKCHSEGRCKCIEKFHQRGRMCFINIGLNQSCESHSQCITPTYRDSNSTEAMNVDCVNGKCICAHDYTTTEDQLDCIRFSENVTSNAKSFGIFSIILFVTLSIIR